MANTVLLVNAPIYDFAAYDLFSKPLGLLYLGSVLRRAGYKVRLLDAMDRHHIAWGSSSAASSSKMLPPTARANGTGKYYNKIVDKPACLKHIPRNYRRYGMPVDMLTAQLVYEYEQYRPVAVFAGSMMTYWYQGVAEIIRLIRQVMPDVAVGLGGIYARLMPQHSIKNCNPDRVFTGADFKEPLKWLSSICNGTNVDVNTKVDASAGTETGADAVAGADTGGYMQNDFPHWPRPAYDLYRQLDYLTVITSLGCPFSCDYCASSFLQKHTQQLSTNAFAAQLNNMLEILKQRLAANHSHNPASDSAYNIAFMDDALLVNAKEHLIPILKNIIAIPEELHLYCPNGLHVRFMNDKIAELMYTAGFRMIRLSYEAADAASRWQKASDNKVSDSTFRQAVQCLIKAGFQPGQIEAYVLTALPGQTMQEMTASVHVVHDMGLKVRLCQYCPIPHTKMFASACKECDIDPDEPLLHNNSVLPCLNKNISYEQYQQFRNYVTQLNRDLYTHRI